VSVDHGTEPKARAHVGGGGRDRPAASVNLARRPFANIRPIQRLGLALWVIGGALAIAAAVLFWRSLFGIETKKAELAAIERRIAAERLQLETAEASLRRMDLRRQNQEASYLNDRIAERTFPWSVLFEDLAEVLPREVRLFSLAPQSAAGVTRASAAPVVRRDPRGGRRVFLQMSGAAESDEALLRLLDNLFASPYFDAPSLPREIFEGNSVQFALSVHYLPDATRPARATDEGGPAEVEELPAEDAASDGASRDGDSMDGAATEADG
jgi:Tfp pilus assembly protein PilN